LDSIASAPGNNAPKGGLKVVSNRGRFAAWPSGTENIYKIYAESFRSRQHRDAVIAEAQPIVNNAFTFSEGDPQLGVRQ
jgi:phosphoglucomutase